MISLEGAACAELPPFVIDKYFNNSSAGEALGAKVGLAICRRCVVLEACRQTALSMAHAPKHGVIGGMTAGELAAARSWRGYEQGITDAVPRRPRPDWLPMTEATELVEQMRLETDLDEQAQDHPADEERRTS